ERSNGNGVYSIIGTVQSIGGSNYVFIDSFPNSGKNQYRLKMIDRDNHYQYSSVLSLSKRSNGFEIQNSFPNPFDRELTLQLTNDKTASLQIQISDMSGKIVYNRSVICNPGSNN